MDPKKRKNRQPDAAARGLALAMSVSCFSVAKRCFVLLAALISIAGCAKHFYPDDPFPEHKFAPCVTVYQPPPILTVTNIVCPDKLITADVQDYVRSNSLMGSIVSVKFYDDKTGWRAVQITELKKPAEQRVCVEHLLEYDSSGVRTNLNKVPWHWYAF